MADRFPNFITGSVVCPRDNCQETFDIGITLIVEATGAASLSPDGVELSAHLAEHTAATPLQFEGASNQAE